jgi:hypothetical protein
MRVQRDVVFLIVLVQYLATGPMFIVVRRSQKSEQGRLQAILDAPPNFVHTRYRQFVLGRKN